MAGGHDRIGRDGGDGRPVHKVAAVDAHEILSEDRFPLADAGLVAERAAVTSHQADFRVVRFYIGYFMYIERNGLANQCGFFAYMTSTFAFERDIKNKR